jgi:transcriptional regulator with XRE-family HTH domain
MLEVRNIRESFGITQQQFALGLGVSVQTVSRWERKKNVPLPMAERRIRAMRDLFDFAGEVLRPDRIVEWFTTPNELLGGESPMEVLPRTDGIERIRNLLGQIEWGITA